MFARFTPDHDGEACGERVSCQHEHRGNSHSHASDAEENETDEMQKESGQAWRSRHLSAKLEEVDESTHTLSTRVTRAALLFWVHSTLCRNMEASVRAQNR